MSLHNPLVFAPILLSFYLALVALLNPAKMSQEQLPALDSVAKRDYRATRTFSVMVEDPVLARQADERVAREPDVYLYDPSVRDDQLVRLNAAFDLLADACEAQDGVSLAHVRRALLQKFDVDVGLEDPPTCCFLAKQRQQAGIWIKNALGDAFLDRKPSTQRDIRLKKGDRPLLRIHYSDIPDREGLKDAVAKEIHGHFVRLARSRPSDLYGNPDVEAALTIIVTAFVEHTAIHDPEASSVARKEIRDGIETRREKTYRLDETIARAGDVITQDVLLTIETMYGDDEQTSLWRTTAGTALSVLILVLLFWYLSRRRHSTLANATPRHLLLAGVVMVTQIGLLKLSVVLTHAMVRIWDVVPPIAYYFALPLAVGPMLVRLFLGSPAAILYAIALSALFGLVVFPVQVEQLNGSPGAYLVVLTLLSALVATARTERIRRRVDILQAGGVVAAFNAVAVFGFCLYDPAPLSFDTLFMVLGGALGGMTAAFLVGAFAPLFEWVFGYTTNIKLLELASLDQPILKRLILEAPGTYHHSFLVGNLVESAAETIGARPLLARVAALYHDLGKLKNPLYFGENQHGGNRHDKLAPSMSALVIRQHVKDSVRKASEAGLGEDICDIIEQHHGTTLVRYFYHKAIEAVEEGETPPQEDDYRYPGPKPQSREAGLVLLADSVEAAVRSLPEKSPARIHGTVRSVILEKFQDGQLEECDLTLRSLNRIEEIFTTVLQGVHHARPEYPQTTSAGVVERSQKASLPSAPPDQTTAE